MSFYVGLDLGQSADYSALAIAEKTEDDDLHLRHLERYPLRTPYPRIADAVAVLVNREEVLSPEYYDWSRARTYRRRPELLVDATGVGVAVTDLLTERGLEFISVAITGGEKVTGRGKSYGVPKKDLVGALEVPFHNGTLKVADGLSLWPTLREEMLNFRRKVSISTGHASYEHWRESDHDDLVLAAALACWGATRKPRLAQVFSF